MDEKNSTKIAHFCIIFRKNFVISKKNYEFWRIFSNFRDGISDYNQFIMLNEVPVRYHFSWIYTLSGFTVIIHYGSIIVYSYVEFEFEFSKNLISRFSQNSDWYHDLNHGPESGLRETGGPSNSGFISIDCYKVLGSRTLKTDLESPWYLVIMRIVLTYTNAQGEKDVLKNILD